MLCYQNEREGFLQHAPYRLQQATAATNQARTNLQTDEGNQWQSAASSGQGRGVGGALSGYEQAQVSKAYAPQFANLEQGLASDISGINLNAQQAIDALAAQGQTDAAQRMASLQSSAMSFLQSGADATTQERQGILNYFQAAAQNATQNQQFQESQAQQQQQFMYPYTHETPYEQAYIGMETGKNSPTQLKEQSQQQMGQAQDDISKTIYALRAQGQTSDQAVQTVVANIMKNAGQYTAEGIDPNMLINYVYQMAGMPSPYKGATPDQAPTTTSSSTGGYSLN